MDIFDKFSQVCPNNVTFACLVIRLLMTVPTACDVSNYSLWKYESFDIWVFELGC